MMDAHLSTAMILGIVGGIGSGKSAVSRLFAEAGCPVIDADDTAHEVLRRPEVRREIETEFGSEVLSSDGSVDRSALADAVFDDSERLGRLNEIVHPAVGAAIRECVKEHRSLFPESDVPDGPAAVLVLDVSLLASSPLQSECDAIAFVDVDRETQLGRCRQRGWSDEELDRRERHQASLETKRAMSRWIVDNSGSMDSTGAQVHRILHEILKPKR